MTALLVLTLACVLGPAPSAWAVGWTAPTTIQPASPSTAGVDNARLAVNARGDQVVIWDDMQDMGSDDPSCEHSEVATRVSGGAWSASSVVPCGAAIAVGSGGRALVFWTDPVDSSAKVATAQAGSSFGAAVTADSVTAQHDGLTGAVNAQGLPTIAWTSGSMGSSAVYAKTANSDGTWSAAATPQTVAAADTGRSYSYPALAVGPQGDAVIAVGSSTYIATNTPTTTYLFQAYARPASPLTWTGTNLIGPAPETSVGTPRVAFDPQGRPTIAVSNGWGSSNAVLAWSRNAGAGSAWSGPQTVESGATYAPHIGMAVDSTGLVQVGYTFFQSGAGYFHAATRAGGSTTWSSPANLVSGGCGTILPEGPPSVSVDGADNALIGFSCAGTEYTFQRVAGSATYSPFTKPAGASSVDYATDPNGYMIATWTAGGVVYTSVYDPVPPTVDSFAASGSAVAGQPASFDLAGSDVWGPVTYSVDFGDGQPLVSGRVASGGSTGSFAPLARAAVSNTVQHTYANPGDYAATVTVTDGAANTVQTTIPVAVAAPATTTQTPGEVITAPPGLPAPTLGETINLYVLKQPVRIKLPRTRRFFPLTQPRQVPNGTVVDARKGRVLVVIADQAGKTGQAEFYAGVFEVNQPKRLRGLANIFLDGGGFKGCPKAPRNPHAQVSANRKRSVRKLWGKGTGKFRTVGRFSSATLRGTTWLTDDRCNGTLTKVRVGKVAVRDFVRRRTVIVRAGKSYFAAARAKRRR